MKGSMLGAAFWQLREISPASQGLNVTVHAGPRSDTRNLSLEIPATRHAGRAATSQGLRRGEGRV